MRSREVISCLKQLESKYRFNPEELKLLKEIENCEISSIAYTVDGGFDGKTGEFFTDETPGCFKVKIKYKNPAKNGEDILYLMKGSNN